MFNDFDFSVIKVIKNAEKEMQELNHPYVGSEHLLLSILNNKNEVSDYLKTVDITYSRFKTELLKIIGKGTIKSKFFLQTPLLKRIIETALNNSSENKDKVLIKNLFLSLLEEGEGIGIRILLILNIDLDKAYNHFKNNNVLSKRNELTIYQLGKVLNDTVDMNESFALREKEINCLIETLLRKNKNNPLLLGKAGVGKTAIVEEFVRKINKNDVPIELQNKKVVMLEMGSLVAGTKYRGEFEERLNTIINEISNNNDIILFIDEIHTLVGAGGAEGAIDASNILKPYLARGNIKCVGATTWDEYNKYINKDKALERRFEKITIDEPSLEETKIILNKVKNNYESFHNINISDENIELIINLCNKYITNRCNPDKALDVLDSVCSKARLFNSSKDELKILDNILLKKNDALKRQDYQKAFLCKEKEESLKRKIKDKVKNINSELVYDVITDKTGIIFSYSKVIDELKQVLGKKVFGQDDVIKEILNIFFVTSLDRTKPLSIHFSGSNGTGKGFVAELIGNCFKKNFIKLNLAEYKDDVSVSKLIGTSAGYVGYNDYYVFESIINNPMSIILFKNIDECSQSVTNIIKQIINNGKISNGKGQNIDFKNCIIMTTSSNKNKENTGFIKSDNIVNIISCDYDIKFKNIIKDDIVNYLKEKGLNMLTINNIIQKIDYKNYGFKNIDKIIAEETVSN